MRLNQGYTYRQVVERIATGQTLLDYLAREFSHSSRLEWESRLQSGEFWVDGRVANGNEVLKSGMIVLWNRPGWYEDDTPQGYRIVFCDDDLLIVDKPSGLPTLPGAGIYLNTLLMQVRQDYPGARPMHRLGRATSGLVLFALSNLAASQMGRDWKHIQKQYQARSLGVAAEDDYDIRASIGLLDHPRLGKVHAADPSGKSARSVARVVQREPARTIFEVDLHTGRPHQIRIHLACIGHPLEGDPLYDLGGVPKSCPGLPGDGGYFLHAKRLVLTHPRTRKPLELECELPSSWSAS